MVVVPETVLRSYPLPEKGWNPTPATTLFPTGKANEIPEIYDALFFSEASFVLYFDKSEIILQSLR